MSARVRAPVIQESKRSFQVQRRTTRLVPAQMTWEIRNLGASSAHLQIPRVGSWIAVILAAATSLATRQRWGFGFAPGPGVHAWSIPLPYLGRPYILVRRRYASVR